MKLEEVPSPAQPFIIVANHNYDQKATHQSEKVLCKSLTEIIQKLKFTWLSFFASYLSVLYTHVDTVRYLGSQCVLLICICVFIDEILALSYSRLNKLFLSVRFFNLIYLWLWYSLQQKSKMWWKISRQSGQFGASPCFSIFFYLYYSLTPPRER